MSDSRQQFEAWVSGRTVVKKYGAKLTQRVDGSYADYRINDRWLAWQASRAASDDIARYQWVKKNVTEVVTQAQTDFAALKTCYQLPLNLLSFASFTGPVSLDRSIDSRISAERGA